MSKGKATIDKEAKTITVEPGSSHEEQTVEFPAAGALSLAVTAGNGKNTVDIGEKGYYVLNAKTDTIIGTYENYNAPSGETKNHHTGKFKTQHRFVYSNCWLAMRREAKPFYILPGKAVKITDNLDATLVGPFNSLTTLEATGGNTPEVYKFYTSKDVRETVAHLQGLTVAPPSPNQ